MTIGKLIAEIEALVRKARSSGITSEQKIAVLHGIIDALKEAPTDTGTSSIAQSAGAPMVNSRWPAQR